jgi:uncharacterized tellurite resistance protein B-like protein
MIMNRDVYIYMQVVNKILEDNILTLDESELLDIITQNLDVDKDTVDAVTAHYAGEAKIELTEDQIAQFQTHTEPKRDKKIFKSVLIQALADEKITKDELEIIKVLLDLLHIGKEDRDNIYKEVKKEIIKRYEPQKEQMLQKFEGVSR